MAEPQYTGHLKAIGAELTGVACACKLSPALADLLIAARQDYDWHKGTGAATSQQRIIDLEACVWAHLKALSPRSAQAIAIQVSHWAGNKKIAEIQRASPAEQAAMRRAIADLIDPDKAKARSGIGALCALPGISLVIASKIYRFCSPKAGAAVDRHASYFFNSLPVGDHAHATEFQRQWAKGDHKASRLAIYTKPGLSRNVGEYFDTYLPLLEHLATELNAQCRQYCCAATGQKKDWAPADVEMAAYYWWSCHGAK